MAKKPSNKSKFHKFRVAAGLTQKEVAKHLGIKEISYRKYESGERYPKLYRLTKLAKLFGCSREDLLW